MPNDRSGTREEGYSENDPVEEDDDLEEDDEYIDDEDDEEDELALPLETIRIFEKTEAQLEGFYEEIGNIAKKKPDDPINTFKLGFINQMFDQANTLLGDGYRPFPDFDRFDLDALPTASDVVMMLSQYLRSMDKYRNDATRQQTFGVHYWHVSGSKDKIRAKPPKKFAK